MARSSFDDMLPGTEFKRVIPESGAASDNAEGVKKLMFCSGKVYYDIIKERSNRGFDDKVAVSRIEQVCCFIVISSNVFQII